MADETSDRGESTIPGRPPTAVARRPRPALVAAGFAIAAAGCSVAPRPIPPAVTLPPAPAATTFAPSAGPAQRLVVGGTPETRWWTRFGSVRIDALVERALVANADIETADAALRQAGALARVAAAGSRPQIDLGYQFERARVSGALSGPLYDQNQLLYSLHTAQVTAISCCTPCIPRR